MVELTENQIENMLQNYLKKMMEEDERDRNQGGKNWIDPDDHVDDMVHLQHDCYRELAIGNLSRAFGAVDRLLQEKKIKLQRDGLSYEKLCREMMKVMINYLEIEIRRTRRDYTLDDLPFPELLRPRNMGGVLADEAMKNQEG